MQQEIDKFIHIQNAKHTKKQYALVLNRFSSFYKGELPAETNWPKAYMDYLIGLNLKNKTINYHLTVLKSFWKYLTGNGLQVHRLKEAKTKVDFFSDQEVSDLLAKATPSFRGVLMFMFDTGVRVSEASKISSQQFETVPKKFIVTGKGDKQRLLMISDETQKYLESISKDGLIFSEKWTIERIQRNLKQTAEAAGITRNIHAHMTRHTFATRMLAAGLDLVQVKDMLGHESLATTQVYTHITAERLEQNWSKVLNQRQPA